MAAAVVSAVSASALDKKQMFDMHLCRISGVMYVKLQLKSSVEMSLPLFHDYSFFADKNIVRTRYGFVRINILPIPPDHSPAGFVWVPLYELMHKRSCIGADLKHEIYYQWKPNADSLEMIGIASTHVWEMDPIQDVDTFARTMYHGTSYEAAQSILRGTRSKPDFKEGAGMLGPGVYFGMFRKACGRYAARNTDYSVRDPPGVVIRFVCSLDPAAVHVMGSKVGWMCRCVSCSGLSPSSPVPFMVDHEGVWQSSDSRKKMATVLPVLGGGQYSPVSLQEWVCRADLLSTSKMTLMDARQVNPKTIPAEYMNIHDTTQVK